MNKLLAILLFVIISNSQIFGQRNNFQMRIITIENSDTSVFCDVIKIQNAYRFSITSARLFTLKYDSISNKYDTVYITDPIGYGPYKFRKSKDGILVKLDETKNQYNMLFSFSKNKTLSSSLFSTSYDSNSEYTWIESMNQNLESNGRIRNCYVFCSESVHQPSKITQKYYIDKISLLPIKIVTYDKSSINSIVCEQVLLGLN